MGTAFAVMLILALAWPVAKSFGEEDAANGGAPTEAPAEGADEAPLGLVPRALFTLEVVDREPGEEITSLSNDHRQIIFFTELRDLTGQRVLHRWEYKGEVVAEVPFEVRGPRWRVYSVKTLKPDQVGEWSVSVVDGYGRVLSERSFSYFPAPALEKPEISEEQSPE